MSVEILIIATMLAFLYVMFTISLASKRDHVNRRMEVFKSLITNSVPVSDVNFKERKESRERLVDLITVSYWNTMRINNAWYIDLQKIGMCFCFLMAVVLNIKMWTGLLDFINLGVIVGTVWFGIVIVAVAYKRLASSVERTADVCMDMLTQIIIFPNKLYVNGKYCGNTDCLFEVSADFKEMRIEVPKTGLEWRIGTCHV